MRIKLSQLLISSIGLNIRKINCAKWMKILVQYNASDKINNYTVDEC